VRLLSGCLGQHARCVFEHQILVHHSDFRRQVFLVSPLFIKSGSLGHVLFGFLVLLEVALLLQGAVGASTSAESVSLRLESRGVGASIVI